MDRGYIEIRCTDSKAISAFYWKTPLKVAALVYFSIIMWSDSVGPQVT